MANLPDITEVLPPEPDAAAGKVFRVRSDDWVYHAYAYPHAAVAVSVIAWDLEKGQVLLIQRGQEPEKGKWCFPGGFLDPGHETAQQTGARELLEETGIQASPEDFTLIDVRSEPRRDPRDHVIDMGYVAWIHQTPPHHGDDAADAAWHSESEVGELEMAFDHQIFWQNAWKRAQEKGFR